MTKYTWLKSRSLIFGIFFLSFFWASTVFCSANGYLPPDTLTLTLLQSIPAKASIATLDHLGQLYVVTTDNALEKYAPDGRLLARFSQNRLGRISVLDASNPLKIMLFYADFRRVLFLDRSLVLLGELDIEKANLPFVRTLALASDGHLWVYDEANFQLKKISAAGETLFESQPLQQVLSGTPPMPAAIHERDGRVFVSDTAQGVFVFDAYAQYNKLLIFKGIQYFSISEDRLFWLSGGEAWSWSPDNFMAEPIGRPTGLGSDTGCVLLPQRLLRVAADNVTVFGVDVH